MLCAKSLRSLYISTIPKHSVFAINNVCATLLAGFRPKIPIFVEPSAFPSDHERLLWGAVFNAQKLKTQGSRLKARGSRLEIPGSRLQAPGSRPRLQAPGFRLQASRPEGKIPGPESQGSRHPGSKVWAQGLRLQAQGLRRKAVIIIKTQFNVIISTA